MSNKKTTLLGGMFSRKDPVASITKSQERFVKSMEKLSNSEEVTDYSISKNTSRSAHTDEKKLAL